MLPMYHKLLDSIADCTHEKNQSYSVLTERHIQALWLEQKYIKSLQTSNGEAIEVLSPGLWNTEAGPDFLKAHLRIGQKEFKGDIEIHLHDSSWYAHRHHEDERYNQVILHLTFWRPTQPKPIIKQNGSSSLVAYLDGHLTIPVARLILLIDLDLYPYKRFAGSGQCSQSLFRNLSEQNVKAFFTSAAYWRCEKKIDYLESRINQKQFLLAAGIAMAMGYKHNAEAFLELFLSLLPLRDLPEQQLFAAALGCCGFLQEGFKKEWEKSHYYQQLRTLWWEIRGELCHQVTLRLDHIRPLNHPVRRLAYVVKLLQDPALEQLHDQFIQLIQAAFLVPLTSKGTRVLKQQLFNLIPDYQDPYWKSHFLFETPIKPHSLGLIGNDLKQEIIINVFIPYLHALVKESGYAQWWNGFQYFYNSFRGIETSKSRYLQLRFFGNGPKAKLLEPALMTQGAYQLHKDFCLHYEASCEGCPFVNRYLENNAF